MVGWIWLAGHSLPIAGLERCVSYGDPEGAGLLEEGWLLDFWLST